MKYIVPRPHPTIGSADGSPLSRCAGEGQWPACGRRAVRGFTLLELIVVVAIFAIFAVLAYGGLDAVLKTRGSVERAQTRLAEAQKAYLRLRDDFQQVRHRPIRDSFGDLQPALRGADNAGVELTRGGWRNPLFSPRPTLERLSYRLEDGALRRRSWRTLDIAQDAQTVDLVVLDQVTDLRWRFLDENREWQTQWPALNSTQSTRDAAVANPPVAVEITLKTRDIGDLRFVFRLGLDPLKLGLNGSLSGVAGDLGADNPVTPANDATTNPSRRNTEP